MPKCFTAILARTGNVFIYVKLMRGSCPPRMPTSHVKHVHFPGLGVFIYLNRPRGNDNISFNVRCIALWKEDAGLNSFTCITSNNANANTLKN